MLLILHYGCLLYCLCTLFYFEFCVIKKILFTLTERQIKSSRQLFHTFLSPQTFNTSSPFSLSADDLVSHSTESTERIRRAFHRPPLCLCTLAAAGAGCWSPSGLPLGWWTDCVPFVFPGPHPAPSPHSSASSPKPYKCAAVSPLKTKANSFPPATTPFPFCLFL